MPDDVMADGANIAGLVGSFREMVQGCDAELYQQFVDVLVERGSPDDPERSKNREFLLYNFTAIYEKGGEFTLPNGKKVDLGAPRLELASQDQHDKAVALSAKLKEALDAEEKARKAWGNPLFQGNKRLIDTFTPRLSPLEKAHRVLGQRIANWLLKQRAQKKAEGEAAKARAREADRKAQEAAASGAHNAGQLAAQAETAKREAERREKAAAESGKSKSSTGGGSHLRTEWDFEILDVKLIPLEYLAPNREKILADGRPRTDGSPGREIPGIRMFPVDKAVVRK